MYQATTAASSGFKVSDVVLTTLKLDIVKSDIGGDRGALYTTSKVYDKEGVLRKDSSSDLGSLLLTVSTADVKGSLESVSSDYGRGSGFKITGPELATHEGPHTELTNLYLKIGDLDTTSKAYDNINNEKVLRQA